MTSTSDTQRAPHDLVVIGASAGGVETLREVVRGLPSDLEATVCVVLHLAPTSPSALAHILERAASIPCRTAVDGEPLVAGEILVAPPDHHLVIEDGRARLSAGPRENGHRPSVDTLFRSAAGARDGRVVGVILSGTRDDGTLGLALIQANGGLTVVQDPKEAMYAGMPSSALSQVDVDAVVPSTRVAEVITAMVRGDPLPPGVDPPGRGEDGSPERVNRFTTICPEYGGVLSERSEAGMPQWECRVGHRYSPESLMAAQARATSRWRCGRRSGRSRTGGDCSNGWPPRCASAGRTALRATSRAERARPRRRPAPSVLRSCRRRRARCMMPRPLSPGRTPIRPTATAEVRDDRRGSQRPARVRPRLARLRLHRL